MKIKIDRNNRITDIYYECEISIASQRRMYGQIYRNHDLSVTCHQANKYSEYITFMLKNQRESVFNLNGMDYDENEQLINVKFFNSERMIENLSNEDVVIDVSTTEEGNKIIRAFYTFMDWIPVSLLKNAKEEENTEINVAGMVRTYIRNGRFVDYPCILHLTCTAYQQSVADSMLRFEDALKIITSEEDVEVIKE